MVKIYTEGHDTVHHPSHYATQALPRHIECQDIRRHLPQAVADAFKYVWRSGSKGTPEDAGTDIRKAVWYLDDFLEPTCTACVSHAYLYTQTPLARERH